MRVLVFGDSITQGFWDTEGGWVARLHKHLSEQTLKNLDDDWIEIYNLGISGDTTEGVIKRLANEVESRHLYEDEDILIFAIGTNDTIMRGAEGFSAPQKYAEELEQILAKAKNITDKIIFVGLYGVIDSLSNPWKYSTSGKGWTNERVWQFERVLRDFCTTNNLPFVQLFETLNEKKEMFADGIHPSNKGHQEVAKLVLPELEKLLS